MTVQELPATFRPRDRYVAWGLTWLAYATYYIGRKGLSVAKKSIEKDLGVSREALGAIDTGYLSAYALGQFLNGLLGDRIGARRLIGYGMLLSAAACALFGSASAALVFFVLFVVNGYAQATGWPGTTLAMAEWTTLENRGSVMAFWSTCYQVGGLAATFLATRLLVTYGWRSAFTVPAVIIAIVGVLVLVLLKPGPRPVRLAHSASEQDASDAEERRRARRAVLRSPLLWCYGGSYFCIKLIRYSLLFWLPYYLSDDLGYDAGLAGYVSTAFEAGGIVGVVVIGIASDRLRRYARSALAAVVLVALAVVLLLQARLAGLGVAANVLGLALVGACLFGPDSLISGAASQDAGGPYAAATATGFVNGIGSIGAILQGIVTVRVSRAFGWDALFAVFVGLAIVAAAALVPTLRRAARA